MDKRKDKQIMLIYRYRLNHNQVIEKARVELSDDFRFDNYYIMENATVHPYIKKSYIDNPMNNISTALYLTKEDDAKAIEHYRKLLSQKVEKLRAQYELEQSKLDNYNGTIIDKEI